MKKVIFISLLIIMSFALVQSKEVREDILWMGNGTGGGGITDHGSMNGLLDDDHTQYVLADGKRNITNWDIWVDEAGDTMTGDLTINNTSGSVSETRLYSPDNTEYLRITAGDTAIKLLTVGSLPLEIDSATGDTYLDAGDNNRLIIRDSSGNDIRIQSILSSLLFEGETSGEICRLYEEGNFTCKQNISASYGFYDYVNIGIGAGDSEHNFDVHGNAEIEHTSTESDDHALEIEVDAAGFGDVKAIFIDYITGGIIDEQDEEIILININQFLATGGDIIGLEVVTTEGGANATGLEVGIQVNPIEQLSGFFSDMDTALNNTIDVLTAFTSTATDVHIFVEDDDTITIGHAVKFEEIEFILDTVASGAGIKPKFYHSAGVDIWDEFSPADGTNGMRDTGVILWLDSDISNWAVGTGSEFLIRINRTRNSLSTPPKEDKVQISAATQYYWDKDGNLLVKSVNASNWDNITLTDSSQITEADPIAIHNYSEFSLSGGNMSGNLTLEGNNALVLGDTGTFLQRVAEGQMLINAKGGASPYVAVDVDGNNLLKFAQGGAGGEILINDAQANFDFTYKSIGDANLIDASAVLNKVGIGVFPTTHKLEVAGGIKADCIESYYPLLFSDNSLPDTPYTTLVGGINTAADRGMPVGINSTIESMNINVRNILTCDGGAMELFLYVNKTGSTGVHEWVTNMSVHNDYRNWTGRYRDISILYPLLPFDVDLADEIIVKATLSSCATGNAADDLFINFGMKARCD